MVMNIETDKEENTIWIEIDAEDLLDLIAKHIASDILYRSNEDGKLRELLEDEIKRRTRKIINRFFESLEKVRKDE